MLHARSDVAAQGVSLADQTDARDKGSEVSVAPLRSVLRGVKSNRGFECEGGFEFTPNQIIYDARLPIGAKATYPLLRHEAYLAYGRNPQIGPGEPIELPPIRELAKRLGCGTTAMKGYIAALAGPGWIETTRPVRGRPQKYVIRTEPKRDKDGEVESESAPREVRIEPKPDSGLGRNPAHSRARDSLCEDVLQDGPPATARGPQILDDGFTAQTTAQTVLDEFNRQFRTHFRLTARYRGKIEARLREHPDLDEQRRAIELLATRERWWKGSFSPAVLYGSAEAFERTLNESEEERELREQHARLRRYTRA